MGKFLMNILELPSYTLIKIMIYEYSSLWNTNQKILLELYHDGTLEKNGITMNDYVCNNNLSQHQHSGVNNFYVSGNATVTNEYTITTTIKSLLRCKLIGIIESIDEETIIFNRVSNKIIITGITIL